MKKDKIRVLAIEFALLITLSLALFVPNVMDRKLLALILTLFAIITKHFIKRKKTKSIYKKQVLWLMIGFGVIYLAVFYLMGIYFGFYKASARFGFKTLLNFILPFTFIIFSTEFIRNTLLNAKWKLSKVIVFICMVLIDLIIYTGVYDLTDFDDLLAVIGFIFFTSIACNLLYNYISIRYDSKGVIAYRLITILFVYIIPYIPDVYIFFRSFLRMIYPYIIYLVLEYTFSKTNYATKFKDREKSIISTTILFILMTILIALISCRFKYGVLVIGSGSMTGSLDKGDAIVFVKYDGGSLKNNEIIVFDKDKVKMVHRIVNFENVNGEYRYYTKGDINKNQDDGYRTKQDIIGKSLFKIKHIGYPSLWIRDIFEKLANK